MSRSAHAGDWRTTHAPGPFEAEPLTPVELHEFLRGGEPEGDLCERTLATAARAQVAIDLAIGEGLHALRKGDRLAQLGCHLDDYAREVLGIAKRTAQNFARLGRDLPTRPLVRHALRSGRLKLRAAETILPVAIGDAEAAWVERAALATVRELEAAVRRARNGCDDEEEDWFTLRTQVPSEERALLDAALDLAGEVMPGSSPMQRLEAIAQEFLGELPGDPDADETAPRDPAFRRLGPREAARRAVLEAETERWSVLADTVEFQRRRWSSPTRRAQRAARARTHLHRAVSRHRRRAGAAHACARPIRDGSAQAHRGPARCGDPRGS